MNAEAVAALLQHVLILRELPAEALSSLAENLPMAQYEANSEIFKQGDAPDALYILLSGVVDLVEGGEAEQTELIGRRYPGDLIGEVEMVYRQPRRQTASVSEDAKVLRWERAPLTGFMKSNADALADLQFLAQGQQLARRLQFDWLREGESVHILTRKNIFILYQKLTLPAILLLGCLFFTVWTLLSPQSWSTWLAIALGFASVLTGIWQWIDWTNDYYLVTDWRTVWLEKVVALYDSRREAPLHTILSVAVNTDMASRMLSFGDVLIRTYTGKLIFRNISRPHTVAAMIEENWRRLRARQDQADREALVDALQDRLEADILDPGVEDETLEGLFESGDELIPDRGPRRQWGFRIRFEEGDVITYRKHWAVLLREIGLPSVLVLFAIGMLGGRIGQLISIIEPMPYYFITLSLLSLSALWWLYRYIDWANDIYQITPDQIIDVYKKPLAREERKVAPIENILGTEVDRKGIVGLLMNYGDVVANVGTTQFIFEGVLDPVSVQQDIVHAQEAFLQKKAEQDRTRRQSEMVELFDIYHDKYAPGDRQEPPDHDHP